MDALRHYKEGGDTWWPSGKIKKTFSLRSSVWEMDFASALVAKEEGEECRMQRECEMRVTRVFFSDSQVAKIPRDSCMSQKKQCCTCFLAKKTQKCLFLTIFLRNNFFPSHRLPETTAKKHWRIFGWLGSKSPQANNLWNMGPFPSCCYSSSIFWRGWGDTMEVNNNLLKGPSSAHASSRRAINKEPTLSPLLHHFP